VAFFGFRRGFSCEEFNIFEEYLFKNNKKSLFLLIAGHPEKQFPEVIFFIEVLDF
jgi:hypothetical protein